MKINKITILAIVVIAIIIISAWFLIARGNRDNFASAEEKIQNYITQISLLASQSIYQFQAIQEAQEQGNLKEALDLVVEEKQRNKEVNSIAIDLTGELKELTKLSLKLSGLENRQKAEQAIQYQIEAISHLLNYGSGVDIILEELAEKYEAMLENREFEIKRNMSQLIELIKKELETASEKSQKFIETLSEIQ